LSLAKFLYFVQISIGLLIHARDNSIMRLIKYPCHVQKLICSMLPQYRSLRLLYGMRKQNGNRRSDPKKRLVCRRRISQLSCDIDGPPPRISNPPNGPTSTCLPIIVVAPSITKSFFTCTTAISEGVLVLELDGTSDAASRSETRSLTASDGPKIEPTTAADPIKESLDAESSAHSTLSLATTSSPNIAGSSTPGIISSTTSELGRATEKSTPDSDTGGGGLSHEAKISIGVGIGVGLLAAMVTFFAWCYPDPRRRFKARQQAIVRSLSRGRRGFGRSSTQATGV
jgi:hypothetical protein